MASSRDPKIIQITHGEHEVSPHLTSLVGSEMGVSDRFYNAPPLQSAPASRPLKKAAVEVNLLDGMPPAKPVRKLPQPQPKPKQKKQERPRPVAVSKIIDQRPRVSFRVAARATVAFLAVALVIVTPLKAVTTYERLRDARHDVEQLASTTPQGIGAGIQDVGSRITAALTTFHTANESIKKIGAIEEFVLRNTPVFGERFGVASRMVAAGEHMSMAAASYMQLFRTLDERADAPLVERLSIFFEGNRAVLSDLDAAAELVRPIDPTSLPSEQSAFVEQARDAILALHNDASYLASAGPIILSTLGSSTPRRYLLVFQNPTELRATGGFIGSFAILDIENGEVKNLQIPAGGSYDLQGTLKRQVFAPLPMHMINPRWEFQDANWFPDFPTSARKLMWFLEKSQGPTVDGVIAINASVLPRLLEVVGSVNLSGGKTLTAATALDTMRDSIDNAKISDNPTRKSQPKEIIATAAPAIIETIKSGASDHFLPLISTLLTALETRDIQLYTTDEGMQSRLAEFGWDGALQDNPGGDFLSVVATNIGGQKTDALITQKIDHQAQIADDGTVTVTVRMNRTQAESPKNFEGGPNVSYVRLYVPRGSTLVRAEGFTTPSEQLFQAPEGLHAEDEDLKKNERELGFHAPSGTRITQEFGHTAFGNWVITTPGSSVDVLVSYVLPFKIAAHEPSSIEKIIDAVSTQQPVARYSVFIQRQSGSPTTTLTSRVLLPDGWRLGWMTDGRAQTAENGALLSIPFTADTHYGLTAFTSTSYATNTSETQKKD